MSHIPKSKAAITIEIKTLDYSLGQRRSRSRSWYEWPHISGESGAYRKLASCLTAMKKVKKRPKMPAIE
jgi:hypothetical protein